MLISLRKHGISNIFYIEKVELNTYNKENQYKLLKSDFHSMRTVYRSNQKLSCPKKNLRSQLLYSRDILMSTEKVRFYYVRAKLIKSLKRDIYNFRHASQVI